MRNLVWLRSDLRAVDNAALHFASRDAGREGMVICVFILSPEEWIAHDVSPARLSLMLRTLAGLTGELEKLNIPLIIEHAKRARDVGAILLETARKHRCGALYFNREYEVDERRRDEQVHRVFQDAGLPVHAYTDQVVLGPDEVQKGGRPGGGYYTVFTPYKRAWIARAEERGAEVVAGHPRPRKQDPTGIRSSAIRGIEGAGMPKAYLERPRPDDSLWPAGHGEARTRLRRFIERRIDGYARLRDVPGEDGTSTLSPYLAIGAISARECFRGALEAIDAAARPRFGKGRAGPVMWMSELIWREFYVHVLAGFPRVCMGRAFQVRTDGLAWRYDEEALERWKQGQTGYPIVDAGMRQLSATGWMHNRARMITAMFLSKHLLIDWRLGEKHFMQNLVDGFFASNNGGWQWAASTGTDAAPYFRIFNPYAQSRKFDPEGAYIRRWVPELRALGAKEVHAPHASGLTLGGVYPPPMVEHGRARARAIEAFRALRGG